MAGLNAAGAIGGEDPAVLDRAEAYIGVLIDDLVTRGTTEPYRMFTSRAEYRLRLRADNADQRLTPRGLAFGCVGPERRAAWLEKARELADARALATSLSATPSDLACHGIQVSRNGISRSISDLLAMPGVDIRQLAPIWPALSGLRSEIAAQLEVDALYAGYLNRQEADIAAFRRDEALALPSGIDYSTVGGLSVEVREKLDQARPATLGAASRISGVTPAAIIAILRHVKSKSATLRA